MQERAHKGVTEEGLGQRIGYIGLGHMGAPMANRLTATGQRVFVCDLDPTRAANAPEATFLSSVPEVAEVADIVMMSLPGPPQVRAAVNSMLVHLQPGSIVIDLSTCMPSLADELWIVLEAAGASFVDAPVTGGVPAASSGTLKLMVGADEALFDRVSPVLSLIANETYRMGPRGTGYAAKLAKNVQGFGATAALVEALMFAQAAGVDMDEMATLLTAKGMMGGGQRDDSHFFRLDLAEKDTRLACELAQQLKVSWDVGDRIHEIFAAGVTEGFGEQELNVYRRELLRRAGVSDASTPVKNG